MKQVLPLCGTQPICASSHIPCRYGNRLEGFVFLRDATMAGPEHPSRWCPHGSRGCICRSKSRSTRSSAPSAPIANLACPPAATVADILSRVSYALGIAFAFNEDGKTLVTLVHLRF